MNCHHSVRRMAKYTSGNAITMTRYTSEKFARVRVFAKLTTRRKCLTDIHLSPSTVYSCWRTPVVGSWLGGGARYCVIGLSFDVMTTTSEALVGTDCTVLCVGDFPRIREVGVTW